MISFIMFNAGSINEAFFNIKGLFGLNKEVFINNYTIYYLKSYLIVLIISIVGSTPLLKNIVEKLRKNKTINNLINVLEPIFLIILLLLVTAYLIDSSYNPFLYFRF